MRIEKSSGYKAGYRNAFITESTDSEGWTNWLKTGLDPAFAPYAGPPAGQSGYWELEFDGREEKDQFVKGWRDCVASRKTARQPAPMTEDQLAEEGEREAYFWPVIKAGAERITSRG